jgi:ketosteroid isomerase-like protein
MKATTANDAKVDLWFRQTLGLLKIDGAWKIAHEHSSVPFYMDGSFKAAVDLKP